MEIANKIEHAEMVEVYVTNEEVSTFRFELKLWLVTNSDSVNYLRWNCDQTVLIVNVASMENCWRTERDPIFLCRTVPGFLWLLHYSGFDVCPLERLCLSERNDIGPGCLLYEHPQFIGSNGDIFNAWISDAQGRVHEHYVGLCTVPYSGFRRRSKIPVFDSIMSKMSLKMKYVKAILREKMLNQGSVTIPQSYEDKAVMDAPQYAATKEIAGYYGAVAARDVAECLGSLVPVYYDGHEEAAEEGHQQLEMDTLSDAQELYEEIEIYDSDSDKERVIEIHETYEIFDDNSAAKIKNEIKQEDDLADMSVPENLSQFLTQSMKACITPLDSD